MQLIIYSYFRIYWSLYTSYQCFSKDAPHVYTYSESLLNCLLYWYTPEFPLKKELIGQKFFCVLIRSYNISWEFSCMSGNQFYFKFQIIDSYIGISLFLNGSYQPGRIIEMQSQSATGHWFRQSFMFHDFRSSVDLTKQTSKIKSENLVFTTVISKLVSILTAMLNFIKLTKIIQPQDMSC